MAPETALMFRWGLDHGLGGGSEEERALRGDAGGDGDGLGERQATVSQGGRARRQPDGFALRRLIALSAPQAGPAGRST